MRSKDKNVVPVLQVHLVQALSIMNYKGDEKITFAKITVALPRMIAAAKRLLERGANSFKLVEPSFYETNIDFDIRLYFCLINNSMKWPLKN